MKYRKTMLKISAVVLFWAPIAALAADTGAPAETSQPAKPATAKSADADCQNVSGSRVRPAGGRGCHYRSFGPLRSYSRRDIEMTGESDLAEALRKLDPVFH